MIFTDCDILAGYDYCVDIDFETFTTSSASSLTSSALVKSTVTSSPITPAHSTTLSGNGVTTPSPVQTGMVSTCDEFYLVASGDTCAAIASDYGISLTDFYAWNPAIGSSCAYLDLSDYVCVNVIGNIATSSVATSTTTKTSTSGISTPSPVQTGMVSTCDEFYMVVSGDSCSAIASNYGIALTDFYSWNPAVGSSCVYLDVDDYVCVGIVGSSSTTATTTSTTTTTPTTTTGNGVTTPTPIQTGTVTDCNAFYYVVSGDSCSSIASDKEVTVAHLEAWNPAIGTDCTNLWLDTYICVGIL